MPEPLLTIGTIGTLIVKKVIETLTGKVTEDILVKLKGDPVEKAFTTAVVVAVERYSAMEARRELAKPLLDVDGPLTKLSVTAELAQVLCFEGEPNTVLIGEQWKDCIDDPPTYRNFTDEAALFIGYLKDALRDTDVFRPVFDSKSLDAIAFDSRVSSETLAQIESQLASLNSVLASHFAEMIHSLNKVDAPIRNCIIDFTPLINEKTRGFVGRKFVYDALDLFIKNNSCGYFIVQGDPGIGKSSLSAHLVRTRGYVHHLGVFQFC